MTPTRIQEALRIALLAGLLGIGAGDAAAASAPSSGIGSATSDDRTTAIRITSADEAARGTEGPCRKRVQYYYRSTTPASADEFKPLPHLSERPADLAAIVGPRGATIPYIVRFELGSVGDGCYGIAMLHDPAREPAPDAKHASSGWNSRLVYIFDGTCGSAAGSMRSAGGVLNDDLLQRGYAIATSAAAYANNPHARRMAGALARVKAQFVRGYGEPRHTIGLGCPSIDDLDPPADSGDSGHVDGAVVSWSPREVIFTTIQAQADARLLVNYFGTDSASALDDAQKRAIAGTPDLAALIRATESANEVPASRLAKVAYDNEGVQFGLQGLNDRTITASQFLDLNERIGGIDREGLPKPTRSIADANGLWIANYAVRLSTRGEGLRNLPTIEYQAYDDEPASGAAYLRAHAFTMRERLRQAGGESDQLPMFVESAGGQDGAGLSPMLLRAIEGMDRWLEAIRADTSDRPLVRKIVARKPADLRDGCNSRQSRPVFIAASMPAHGERCEALYPTAPMPREVAGTNSSVDIAKCALKPVSSADYAVRFTDDEMARLASIFPRGVCYFPRASELKREVAAGPH